MWESCKLIGWHRSGPSLKSSNYLADAYETYSSSAQAAQSCVRNVGAAVIPLFANQMVSILIKSKIPLTRIVRAIRLRQG